MTQEEIINKLLNLCNSKKDQRKEMKMLIILIDDSSHYNLPLIQACITGNLKHVKLLIEHGADMFSYYGKAILEATAHDNLEVLKYLFDNGAAKTSGRSWYDFWSEHRNQSWNIRKRK